MSSNDMRYVDNILCSRLFSREKSFTNRAICSFSREIFMSGHGLQRAPKKANISRVKFSRIELDS